MTRYYFDMRDGDGLVPDEEGIDLPDLRSVQIEAARSLADMARDAVYPIPPMSETHRMVIEVRDDQGPVMDVKFSFALEKVIR
ncbi:hypothetical protein AOQ73_09030 [Bradyrhizobium pachyrhizi]|uniref:DUF6894 family protein n=1 Tax=Bradyrhizobium pachyrhizi TaxID=280333 RepID=UPI000704CB42|nr:hypothetical protein [Bradyrhizobium pachyrhizi]KRQ10011.1 hypothetical protein AOQ73_09030 [Bradyrhizobium pachyrhizi]